MIRRQPAAYAISTAAIRSASATGTAEGTYRPMDVSRPGIDGCQFRRDLAKRRSGIHTKAWLVEREVDAGILRIRIAPPVAERVVIPCRQDHENRHAQHRGRRAPTIAASPW